MKYVILVFVCVLIFVTGYGEISKQHQKTGLIDEAVRLIGYIRTQLNYRRPDCETLYLSARTSGFDCISLINGRIVPSGDFPDKVKVELDAFFSSLGTTDADGQIHLCNEYYDRLKELFEEQRRIEKSKIHVDFAVSLLGVFSVIVLFL